MAFRFSTIGFSFLLIVLAALTGCINDNELEFPEDRSDELTSTPELFTLFNYFKHNSDRPECFSIIFPIELGYNTGIIISVDDRSGLVEVLGNQTNSFYVDGVILPVLVNKNGVLSSIESAAELRELLDFCEIPGLSRILSKLEGQCFEFEFPLSLIDNNDTLLFTDEDDYEDYVELRGELFSPQLIFPVLVEIEETDEIVSVTNYFELLQIADGCEECPEGSIVIDPEFNGTYTFKAEYDDDGGLPVSYQWYINDDLIGEGSADSKDSLNIELPDGEYEVCLQSFHSDCVEGTFTCRSLIVDRPCPALFFDLEKSNDNPRLYYFYANFALQDDISYGWVVYKNNEFIYFEGEVAGQGDGKLTYEFEPGSYSICLEKENVSENCQLAQFCRELVIE